MSLVVVVDMSVLNNAIEHAGKLGESEPLSGMNAPLDGITRGRVSEVWASMTTAIRKAFELGEERARQYLDDALATCREVLRQAGAAAVEVERALKERLRDLIRSYIDGALGVMQSSVRIGDRELVVASIAVEQKVLLGGDLTLSLEQAFKLAASGEIKVATTYNLTTPPGSGSIESNLAWAGTALSTRHRISRSGWRE